MNRPAALRAIPLIGLALALGACTSPTEPPASAATPSVEPPSATASTVPAPSDPPPSAPATAPPAAVSEEEFFAGTPAVAVWLVIGDETEVDAWEPIRQQAADSGYDVAAVPLGCHDASLVALEDASGDTMSGKWGLPVFFATDADAAAFVSLWTGDTPVVVGTSTVACDFD